MGDTPLDARIRIRAPLRCDGIGRLDCAEDAESGGRLAVRWLPLDANGDAAAKACERLPEHPMLPRIRQTGHVGSSAFVAMEFPDGALLSTLTGERLEADRVIRLGAQLSSALATVHSQGVVHGEISADSVLLVAPDAAYLWDMPLVIANRMTDRRGENRLMQNLVKTAPFLAPERARGEGASQASDVYALGAVLCASAGAPLPSAATTLAIVHEVATGRFVPRVPKLLPEPYCSMLARMLSADPADRPTAAEVADTFGEEPTPAAFPTVPEMAVVKLPPELLARANALLEAPAEAADEVVEEAAGEAVDEAAEAAAPEAQPGVALAAADEAPVPVGDESPDEEAPAVLEEAPAVLDEAPAVVEVLEAAPVAEVVDARAPTPVDLEAIGADAAEVTGASKSVAAEAAPTAEKPAEAVVEAPAAPTSSDWVQMTDNVAVAGELARAGAETLPDEAERRSRQRVVMLAGGLGGAIIALLAMVVVLLVTGGTASAEPTTTPEAEAPVAAAAPAVASPFTEEVELIPLPAPRPQSARSRRAAPAAKPEAVEAKPEAVESNPAAVESKPAATEAKAEAVEAPPAPAEAVAPEASAPGFAFDAAPGVESKGPRP